MIVNYGKISFLVNKKAEAGIFDRETQTFTYLSNNLTIKVNRFSLVFEPHFTRRSDKIVFSWRTRNVSNSFFDIDRLGSFNAEIATKTIDTNNKSKIKKLENYFMKNFTQKVEYARKQEDNNTRYLNF